MSAHAHVEVIRAIEPQVARALPILSAPASAWQPADYLPDFSKENWVSEVAELRRRAQAVPDDLLVVLVGDAVTEEALPSYSMALNQLVQDREGTSAAPWARWLRGWTAEENRHGDLLSAYLRLSGRVDMGAVERSVHGLIAAGFNPGTDDDPYRLLVYTSFQERATRVSHANVARLAERAGDATLARLCRIIAGDEARHETFYTRAMGHVLDLDPVGGVEAVATMFKAGIAMPGRLMSEDDAPGVFDRFAAVAQRIGVYTALDYAAITNHLVSAWGIATRHVSGDAARLQDEVCRLAERQRRLAERLVERASRVPSSAFSWIRREHSLTFEPLRLPEGA